MTSLLNENLERDDLVDLVDSLFFVDRHVSKLGTDAEVATLTFKVGAQQAAQDLAKYIEKAYDWVLDADATPGPDQFNKYSVFVEINRTPKLAKHIQDLLKEIENISGKLNWQFKYKKDMHTYPVTLRTLLDMIPKTKNEYLNMLRNKAAQGVKEFFTDSNIHSLTVSESGDVKLIHQRNEWSPKQVIGFKMVTISEAKPSNLFPSQLSRTINGLLGQNFVVEEQGDKFIIHNGKVTLEVTDLYAEKQ